MNNKTPAHKIIDALIEAGYRGNRTSIHTVHITRDSLATILFHKTDGQVITGLEYQEVYLGEQVEIV